VAVERRTPRSARPTDRRAASRPLARPTVSLCVLDAFELRIGGEAVDVPHPAQRLLALLAVKRHALQRGYAAGVLWLNFNEERAAANLRSALWRVRALGVPVVDTRNGSLQLLPWVDVDLHAATSTAHRWLSKLETDADRDAGSAAVTGDLLPDWYEDWLTDDRESFRQLRLHALETMAERLADGDRCGDAILAALAAVAADPLRESAHRAVIKVHLAEGNVAEAIRQLRRCERLMLDEVGVPPSSRLAELINQGG
jgi:DNA-binding SARP family transcriptional activator